jgi:hypothetical protein
VSPTYHCYGSATNVRGVLSNAAVAEGQRAEIEDSASLVECCVTGYRALDQCKRPTGIDGAAKVSVIRGECAVLDRERTKALDSAAERGPEIVREEAILDGERPKLVMAPPSSPGPKRTLPINVLLWMVAVPPLRRAPPRVS